MPTVADDALTDAEREALRTAVRVDLHDTGEPLFAVVEQIARRARAEGARDALNAAADKAEQIVGAMEPNWIAVWLREQAAKHEEQR